MAATTPAMEFPLPIFGKGPSVAIIGQDGRTIETWLCEGEAAACRVIHQDATLANIWLQQKMISLEVHDLIISQLTASCVGPHFNGQRPYGQYGSQLCERYAVLNYQEQVRWLLEDLSTRRFLASKAKQAHYCASTQSAEINAFNTLLYMNDIQSAPLESMLSRYPQPELARIAAIVAPIQAPLSAGSMSRTPLAPISGNVPVKAESSNLKRKREAPAHKKASEVISQESDSEDENTLQGRCDAIQAKIEAIKYRTAHEDEVLPNKKTKTASKKNAAPRAQGSASVPMDQAASLQSALEEPRPTVSSANLTVVKQESSSAGSDNMHATKENIQLVIKAKVRGTFRLTASPRTQISKLVKAAKHSLRIAPEQAVVLRFDGEELAPSSLVRDADLQDFDSLELHEYATRSAIDEPSGATSHNPVPTPSSQQRKAMWHHNGLAQQRSSPCSSAAVDLTSTPPRACSHGQAATSFGAACQTVDLTSSSPLASGVQMLQQQPSTSVPPAPIPALARTEPELCPEQQNVVDLIMRGHNVFYTGSAGCGKSTVLKAFVSQLRDQGKVVRIVAPTGKAALDINGSTTWTFAGWTPGHMKKPLAELVHAAHGKFVSKRFRETNVLVIDEISMVENHLLTRLNYVLQAARGNERPFGGLQLVVTGDFCQLPPVKPFQYCMHCGRARIQKVGPGGETLYRCAQHGDVNDDDKWAFQSRVWRDCNFKHINLTNIHRQSDEVFIRILQKLRVGKPLTNADRQLLQNHPCDVTNAVKLFPTREEVRRINQTEFDKLNTESRSYTCLDYFRWNEQHGNLREKGRRKPRDNSLDALREHKLETTVEFKAGMLVVLLVNLDIANGLVNGSQGRIITFEPYVASKLPKATVRGESSSFSSTQRGGNKRFSSKRGRGREDSMEPPEIQGELRGEYASLREGLIKDFIEQDCNRYKMWPVVDFGNGIRRTIYADCQVNELGDEKPYTLLARTQVPLIAAWAMTIHKSQGMTLNRVIVDLGRSFEEGQEYVALSRARSLDGLKVERLGDNVGKGGNEQVKKFLREKFGI